MRWFICLLLSVLPMSAAEELRVLMIGNSYTAQTQRMVKGFLQADPELSLLFASHTPGGAFLEQHAKNPKVAALLEKEPWDVIVLQEQSQLPAFAMNGSQPAKDKLAAGGPLLIKKIRKVRPEARILLFQTWARHRADDRRKTLTQFGGDPIKMQDALTRGYEWIKKSAGGEIEIVPVGQAFERWYAAKGYDEDRLTLHKGDQTHPGKLGAYLTGAAFYRAITGRDPSGVDFSGDISDEVIRMALLEAVAKSGQPD